MESKAEVNIKRELENKMEMELSPDILHNWAGKLKTAKEKRKLRGESGRELIQKCIRDTARTERNNGCTKKISYQKLEITGGM